MPWPAPSKDGPQDDNHLLRLHPFANSGVVVAIGADLAALGLEAPPSAQKIRELMVTTFAGEQPTAGELEDASKMPKRTVYERRTGSRGGGRP